MFHALFGFTIFSAGIPTTFRCGMKVHIFLNLFAKLKYVASKYGVIVHKIDRFYPSSKMCTCGYVNKQLQLKDRQWTCPECGAVHSRDLLAAQNILRQGIAELESTSKTPSARRAHVRLHPRISSLQG